MEANFKLFMIVFDIYGAAPQQLLVSRLGENDIVLSAAS